MPDRLRRVSLAAVCLLVAMSCASCSSSPSASSSPASATPAKVAARISAPALYTAFTTDKASADGLYKGKLLEVTGTVAKVDSDPILNAPEIMLAAGTSTRGRGVDCVLSQGSRTAVAALHKGQTIAVVGTCDGYAVNVLLLHCRLLKGKGGS